MDIMISPKGQGSGRVNISPIIFFQFLVFFLIVCEVSFNFVPSAILLKGAYGSLCIALYVVQVF